MLEVTKLYRATPDVMLAYEREGDKPTLCYNLYCLQVTQTYSVQEII